MIIVKVDLPGSRPAGSETSASRLTGLRYLFDNYNIQRGGEPMFKINQIKLESFLAYPLQTGLFITDLAILMFLPIVRPPVVLSVVLVFGLVYLSMFFGAEFSSGARPSSEST